jgi:hypothetical protein
MDDPERAPAMAAIDMPPRFDTAAVEVRSGPLFTTGG